MSKKSRSKLWFLVHSWLALPIWFFVLIVCVTGTLAVVSQEIVWLANPQMRASQPSDDAPRLSYDQILAAIKKPNRRLWSKASPARTSRTLPSMSKSATRTAAR